MKYKITQIIQKITILISYLLFFRMCKLCFNLLLFYLITYSFVLWMDLKLEFLLLPLLISLRINLISIQL